MGGEETIYAAIDQGAIPEDAIEVIDYTTFPFAQETCQAVVDGKKPNAKGAWEVANNDGIGLSVVEGLTQMAKYLMDELATLAAEGKGKFGQDTPIQYQSGTTKMGGNPPSHFGIVQRNMLRLVEDSRRLPGWVIWTAHERDAEDKETQEKLVGPDVAGKALTSKIGGSFGNTIHLDSASKTTKSKDSMSGREINVVTLERRAYFQEHFDPDGLLLKKYFANNRAFNPERLPASGYLTPPDPLTFYALLKGTKNV